ncbi:type IV pilus biogenesis protein PilP [Yersinia enterocolitica]
MLKINKITSFKPLMLIFCLTGVSVPAFSAEKSVMEKIQDIQTDTSILRLKLTRAQLENELAITERGGSVTNQNYNNTQPLLPPNVSIPPMPLDADNTRQKSIYSDNDALPSFISVFGSNGRNVGTFRLAGGKVVEARVGDVLPDNYTVKSVSLLKAQLVKNGKIYSIQRSFSAAISGR